MTPERLDTYAKVAESNRIEGIARAPTDAEIAAHDALMALDVLTVEDMERFVAVYQPGAKLRERVGMNVRVGNYQPPSGDPVMREALAAILEKANLDDDPDPWAVHIEYESLHPFMDGNGRCGRALWYWMMRNERMADLGFLHAFYYQTLQGVNL